MKKLKQHPDWTFVDRICGRLQQSGYQAYLAGGCVRDALIEREAGDFDIATSATPDQVEALFDRTEAIGKQFGVILVVIKGRGFEVATFRSDGVYVDGRHPEEISFSDAKVDALRRDFTINAMFYDSSSQQVLDYVDGKKDLQSQIIRAVGDPKMRFQEDHLRILRAIRFATQLNFSIDPLTWQEVITQAQKVQTLAKERVHTEIQKIIASDHLRLGINLLDQSGLWQLFFPETVHLNKLLQINENWTEHQKWLYILLHQNIPEDKKLFWSRWRFSRKSQMGLQSAWTHIQSILQKTPDYKLALGSLEESDFSVLSHFQPGVIESADYQWCRSCVQNPLLSAAEISKYVAGKQISASFKNILKLQIEREVGNYNEALDHLKSLVSSSNV